MKPGGAFNSKALACGAQLTPTTQRYVLLYIYIYIYIPMAIIRPPPLVIGHYVIHQ
jgi:hypothetical protein